MCVERMRRILHILLRTPYILNVFLYLTQMKLVENDFTGNQFKISNIELLLQIKKFCMYQNTL